MKYQAIKNRLVVKQPNTVTSTSGIIVASPIEHAVINVEVVETTELTKLLQGKIVCVERRHCVELSDDGEFKYASIKAEDILAVKE